MTSRCSYIMPGGERCKGVPVRGSDLCAAHHPDYRERRRTGARRGGKARGAGELAGIKGEIRTVIVGVLNGEVPTGRAAVAIQGYNTLLRAVEVERRVRELDELEERLEALESRVRGHAG